MNRFRRAVLLCVIVLVGLPVAKADILRLRDGRMLTGEFLGATKEQIWFQTDAAVNLIGPTVYSVAQVESVTFGPAEKQSNAMILPKDSRNAVDVILVTLARESQKANRSPDQ